MARAILDDFAIDAQRVAAADVFAAVSMLHEAPEQELRALSDERPHLSPRRRWDKEPELDDVERIVLSNMLMPSKGRGELRGADGKMT